MTERPSVAIVEPIGGHGGMNPYDFALCEGLLTAGVRVSLYTCDETVDPCIVGLRFCPIFKKIYGGSPLWTRALRALAASIRMVWSSVARGETIIHVHVFQGAALELALILLAKCCRRKVVLTVHDVESLAMPSRLGPRIGRGMVGRIYGLADRVIAHNRTSEGELIERLRLRRSRIAVIPHGNYAHTILKTPSIADARRNLGIPSNSKVILFFGQIKTVKGLDLLIDALPSVILSIPNAVAVVAGRPWKADFSQYAQLIERAGVKDHCLLHIRYIPDEQISHYYSAADIVVLPYRRIYQSGVVLLAMSYGKAVVTSDIPGMCDVVSDRDNGYLFKSESKDELAKVLISALQSDQELADIGARALAYVTRHHDWTEIGAMTAQLYRDLLVTVR